MPVNWVDISISTHSRLPINFEFMPSIANPAYIFELLTSMYYIESFFQRIVSIYSSHFMKIIYLNIFNNNEPFGVNITKISSKVEPIYGPILANNIASKLRYWLSNAFTIL